MQNHSVDSQIKGKAWPMHGDSHCLSIQRTKQFKGWCAGIVATQGCAELLRAQGTCGREAGACTCFMRLFPQQPNEDPNCEHVSMSTQIAHACRPPTETCISRTVKHLCLHVLAPEAASLASACLGARGCFTSVCMSWRQRMLH